MKLVHLFIDFSGTLTKLFAFFLRERLSWWMYVFWICSEEELWIMLNTSIIMTWYTAIWLTDIIFIFSLSLCMLTQWTSPSPCITFNMLFEVFASYLFHQLTNKNSYLPQLEITVDQIFLLPDATTLLTATFS